MVKSGRSPAGAGRMARGTGSRYSRRLVVGIGSSVVVWQVTGNTGAL